MLLGRTLLCFDLSRDRSTTLVLTTLTAAVLLDVGEEMDELPEELLLLEMDIGEVGSPDPPDPDSEGDSSCCRQDRLVSLLRRAIFAGRELVGDPMDTKEPVGDPRLLMDMGDVGSEGLVSQMVALMVRFMPPVLVCV